MHGEDRHTQIHHIDVHMRYILGDGSTATLVYRTKLTGLPVHSVFFHDSDHLCHGLCAGIVGARLSACSGLLGQDTALVDVAGVIRLIHIRKGRVVSRVNIGRKAKCVLAQILDICPLHLGQTLQIML